MSKIKKRKTNKITKSVKKIKANENKYTVLLVLIFISIFTWIGYNAFGIKDENVSLKKVIEQKRVNYSTISNGQVITLTEKDVLSDEKGLERKGYKFQVKNEGPNNIKYRIRLVRDKDMSMECGCLDKSISFTGIRYSLDGEHVNAFMNEDMVIDSGVLNNNDSNTINLRIWIDEKYRNSNNHFHGHIDMEEMQK